MRTLIKQYVEHAGPIRTIAALRDHLKEACRIEMSTIPVYLYALYSLKVTIPKDRASTQPAFAQIGAYETIRSVVIEEMLHVLLARNLLTAVGGHVRFATDSFTPDYPEPMLHRVPRLVLHLRRCDDTQLKGFMEVETPDQGPHDDTPETDTYHTLAELYESIEEGFEYLDAHHHDELWKDPRAAHQVSVRYHPYWAQSGGGAPIVVTDLPTARQAMKTIVLQGEGRRRSEFVGRNPLKPIAPDNPPGFSHYEKFTRVLEGWEPRWPAGLDETSGLWPVETDPHPARWPADVRALSDLFDGCYAYTLALLDELYATPYPDDKPKTSRKHKLIQNMLTSMGALLYPVAAELVRQPVGKDEDDRDVHAGPPFRFRPLEGETPAARREHLLAAFDRLGPRFPALVGENSPRALLALLEPV